MVDKTRVRCQRATPMERGVGLACNICQECSKVQRPTSKYCCETSNTRVESTKVYSALVALAKVLPCSRSCRCKSAIGSYSTDEPR